MKLCQENSKNNLQENLFQKLLYQQYNFDYP